MSEPLPNSWAYTHLDQIAVVVAGNPAPQGSEHFKNGEFNFVRVHDMGVNSNNTLLTKTRDLINDTAATKMRLIPANSVLFTKSGASTLLNQRTILAKDSYVVSHIAAAIPSKGVESKWLFYFLLLVDFATLAHATNMPSLPLSRAKAIRVPIAPMNEQIRIVAKIEELFSELDKGVESLKTARAQLKVYRQAVLKDAFEGKLTAKWREENKDKLETPEQLLARIKKEREARYQAEVEGWEVVDTKWQNERKDDHRTNKPRKPSNIVTINAKKNEMAPTSWLPLRIDSVCDIVDGDRGPNYPKKDDYLPDGHCLFLNAKNVTKKGFMFDECQFISEEKHRLLRKGDVEIGDIIFTSRGTIGNIALHSVALDFGAIRINSGMFILRNYSPIMIGEYFTWLLTSPIITKQIKRLNSGTAQPQLPIREFKQFVIPVPSIPEQEVIVRTIEAKMSIIDAIMDDLTGQLSSADALRQSILKKAFSGQLVMQNPRDEPASVLLDGIKAERKQAAKNNTPKKTKKKVTA